MKSQFGDFKENCFPRGSLHGCKCTVTTLDGTEEVKTYDSDADCKKPVESMETPSFYDFFGIFTNFTIIFTKFYSKNAFLVQAMENKARLNEEFKQKYGNLKENCFPRPKGGCRCVEKDADGNEVEKKFDSEADCNVSIGLGGLRIF